MNFKTLVNELSLTGGFSYNAITGESNSATGYMVSLNGYEEQFDFNDVDNNTIRNYFLNHLDSLNKEEAFLGGWVDNNKVYLDVSVNISDLETAIYTGIMNNQKAIYDCANKRSINIPAPQTSGTMTQNRTYNVLKAAQLAYIMEQTGIE